MENDINEYHVRSVAELAYVVTAGKLPFLQYNLPYSLRPPDVGELAESVVSTVKSGFFRVASGVLFGNSKDSEQDERQKILGKNKVYIDSMYV